MVSAPSAALTSQGTQVGGIWMREGNRVVLAENQIDHGSTVRHEMLHALLGQAGHPRADFLNLCASLVGCAPECVRDAGPWKLPAERVELPPESLSVSAVRVRSQIKELKISGASSISVELLKLST